MPQTGAAIGAGLFLLSAMLAPRLPHGVSGFNLASALFLLVHPAAWSFGIVALLLILQRWSNGRIEGRRGQRLRSLFDCSGTPFGLAAFLAAWASLSVAPNLSRAPEVDLTALAEMTRGLPGLGAGLAGLGCPFRSR